MRRSTQITVVGTLSGALFVALLWRLLNHRAPEPTRAKRWPWLEPWRGR